MYTDKDKLDLVNKFIEAGHAEANITADDLKVIGLKMQKTFRSKSGANYRINSWEKFCSFVYEKLTGEVIPRCNLTGRVFRSKHFGKVVADAIEAQVQNNDEMLKTMTTQEAALKLARTSVTVLRYIKSGELRVRKGAKGEIHPGSNGYRISQKSVAELKGKLNKNNGDKSAATTHIWLPISQQEWKKLDLNPEERLAALVYFSKYKNQPPWSGDWFKKLVTETLGDYSPK